MRVEPKETIVTVVPSEDIGYVCALLIHNEHIDATLRMTPADVQALRSLLVEYEEEAL